MLRLARLTQRSSPSSRIMCDMCVRARLWPFAVLFIQRFRLLIIRANGEQLRVRDSRHIIINKFIQLRMFSYWILLQEVGGDQIKMYGRFTTRHLNGLFGYIYYVLCASEVRPIVWKYCGYLGCLIEEHEALDLMAIVMPYAICPENSFSFF